MSDKFECKECGKEFDTERGLHIHIGEVHPDKKEELLEEEQKTEEKFGCDECGKEFDTERGLHIHQGEVHKEDEEESDTEGTAEQEESEEKSSKEKEDEEKKESIWKKVFFQNPVRTGLAAILVALAVFGFMNASAPSSGQLTPEQVGNQVVEFFSMNPQLSGAEVTLVNSSDTGSGVYKMAISVSSQSDTRTMSYYGTKDGQFIFPAGYETDLEKGSEVEPSEAGEKAAATVEKIVSENNPGVSDVSVEFTNYTGEVSGVYRVNLKYSAAEVPSKEATGYVTKDGSMVFDQGYNLTEQIEQLESSQTQQTSFEPEKSETPEVELYVQSFCPYGNQAEESLESVHKLLKDHVDWNQHFIVREQNDEITSLHGQVEVDQDARELCVIEEYGMEKWFDFANEVNRECGQEGECWEDAAETVNISTETVKTCVEENGEELLQAEANRTRETGVSASPTFMVNGEKYQGSRTPEAFKQAVCSAFEEKPEACETELSTSQGAAEGNC